MILIIMARKVMATNQLCYCFLSMPFVVNYKEHVLIPIK